MLKNASILVPICSLFLILVNSEDVHHVFFTKSILDEHAAVGVKLRIKYAIFNQGPVSISDVSFDDSVSYPGGDFTILKTPKGYWSELKSKSNVSVEAIVVPLNIGYLNASSATLYFSLVGVDEHSTVQTKVQSSSPGFVYSIPKSQFKQLFTGHKLELFIFLIIAVTSIALPYYLRNQMCSRYSTTTKSSKLTRKSPKNKNE